MKVLVTAIVIFLFSSVFAAQTKTSEIDSLMNYMHVKYNFDGVALVAVGKTVVYRKAFGTANREWNIPNTPDTKFRLGSISKQFIGFVTIKLAEQGKVVLDDQVSKYIPAFQISDKKDITIRNLLTQTSGVFDYTDIPEFNSMAAYPQAKLVEMIAAHKLNFEPSAKYAYSNSNFYLLTVIAEKISGRKFEDVLSELVLRPLGMDDTGIEHNSIVYPKHSNAYIKTDKGYRNAEYIEMDNVAAGMYGTADDLLKWSVFIQSQLAVNKTYAAALKPFDFSGGERGMYSSGWCIFPGGVMHQGHINGFANEILIDGQTTVILLSNNGFKQLYATAKLASLIASGGPDAANILFKGQSPKAIEEYAGDYVHDGATISIKIEKGEIVNYFNGTGFTAKPFLKDELFAEAFEGNIRFKRDRNGNITAFESFENYNWVEWKKKK